MSFFILVDPQKKLDAILSEHASIFGFTFDTVLSEKEFVSKFAKQNYTAAFVVEDKKIGDLLTFVHKYANQKDIPFCALMNPRKGTKTFRSLKEELKISYVIETPPNNEEISAVLRKFCNLEEKKESDEKDKLPPELVEKYQNTIYEKIETIEEQIHKIEESYGSKNALIDLRNTVHKIAGSAGAYGFGEAGRLCKAHELFLYDVYSSDAITLSAKEIEDHNQHFLRSLKLAFQNIIPRPQKAVKKAVIAPSAQKQGEGEAKMMPVFLVLVSSDLSLVRLFQKIATQRQLKIEAESDPKLCLEKWIKRDIHPSALILEEHFPFTSYTGIELILKLREHWKDCATTYGLITLADELDKRMQWLAQGVDLVLKKPLTQENISSIFDQISSKRKLSEVKALIVEDDEDIGAIEATALTQLGMDTFHLQDETRLLKTLEEYDPDLILLDINLPHYNGRELLQTLRADIRFSNLIIVIVTAITTDEFDQWAYAANCDEIIHKPIDISQFQARINNLVHRHSALKSKTRLDPTTGLYPRDYFLAKVNDLFARSLGMQAALTIISLDQWDTLNSLLAPLELKDLLIQVAEQIKGHFIKNALVGYLNNGSFGLVFLNSPGGEIEFVINAFYEEVRRKILIAGRENIKISVSSSTSLFSIGKISLGILVGQTEKNLQQIQEKGSSHTDIKRLTEGLSRENAKRVILVDDDKDLCEVIDYAFKNHGFETKVFYNGTDAIDYFAKLETLDENSLIILDRILPDRDGLTLLHLIQEKFPRKVKAIFLSSLSTEKDVLEGLKKGALDYVTKPFSVSVLLQKALSLLNQ